MWTIDTATGISELVFETTERLLEAPNWSSDGSALLLNGDGLMWRLDLSTGGIASLEFPGLPDVNNDHVLSFDGRLLFLSAMDHHIYVGEPAGGPVRRVTTDRHPDRLHYLHGVSPDSRTLAYIGLEPADGTLQANVFTLDLRTGEDRQLTFGSSPADGSEFTPDGDWLYFNTEQFSTAPGHAQLARMRPDGSDMQQLTFDERVNWFPHIAPDGGSVAYLSYEPGTTGHPADRSVEIRLVSDGDFRSPSTLVAVAGGQGTINVNSWAPNSRSLAYVSYDAIEGNADAR